MGTRDDTYPQRDRWAQEAEKYFKEKDAWETMKDDPEGIGRKVPSAY